MEHKKNNGTNNAEEKAYRSIIGLILNGSVGPGEFLLEEDLAKDLEMSRTPVSRALSRLVAEGFIDKLPKRGCFVPIPTPKDAEEVFGARIAVESQNAAIAALKATEEEIDELQRVIAMDEHVVVTFSKESFSNINEAFHLGIAKIARNAYLERWSRYIYWRSSIYIFYFDSFYVANTVSDVPPQLTPTQHAAILEAIRRRDSEMASSLMAEHLKYTYSQLFSRRVPRE